MLMKKIFCVADHLFAVNIQENVSLWPRLANYLPFEIEPTNDCLSSLIFALDVREQTDTCLSDDIHCVVEYDNDVVAIGIYSDAAGTQLVRIAANKYRLDEAGWLVWKQESREITLLLKSDSSTEHKVFVINNSLMLLYAMFTAGLNTLLMHASVVTYSERAFVFLGKSGTGKSTHSRLWLEHIAGTSLLNDDNPVIRILDNHEIRVYGSPWSGKTPCYKNESAKLGAVVRLSQAPVNEIERLEGVAAYIAVLPSASGMKWDRKLTEGMHNTLAALAHDGAVFQLKCRPDREAAVLCNRIVTESL